MLSADIPLLRLGEGETWSTLLLRSGTTFVSRPRHLGGVESCDRAGAYESFRAASGLSVAGLYGLASICLHDRGLQHEDGQPCVSSWRSTPSSRPCLSWVFLKERPKTVTFIAMFFMLIGVGIIVREGLSSGHAVRRPGRARCPRSFLSDSDHGQPVLRARTWAFAAIAGTALPMLVAACMVSQNGYTVAVPGWIIFNGAVVTTLAFLCLAAGPTVPFGTGGGDVLSAGNRADADLGLAGLCSERPSDPTLAGGLIIITASLVGHSLWQMHHARKRYTGWQALVRHPV